ncbi:PLAT/LH2 domain-containing lipoxygenase family protein [Perilla frutescens var. hirtella]|nr:PLAT/LH2 domain-containing lipoxygenase family protein [Perilla frutescens var. hirtella]
MELSSVIYKNWTFPDQALPVDLVKRGTAVEDPDSPHGVKLVVKDYPYAVDGLEIWSAISTWVEDYCSSTIQRTRQCRGMRSCSHGGRSYQGHGDKRDEAWWPRMQSSTELIDSLTIIIWIASALHAAVNFGQYPYAGYMPNRPTVSRQFMPEPGSQDYEELKTNPDKVFLKIPNSVSI